MKAGLTLILFALGISLYSADYYWIGGSGDWSDINNWATSSGGNINYNTVPSASDNVIFDQNSFPNNNCVVNFNLPQTICRDLDFSNATINHSISSNTNELRIHGSLKLNSKTNFNLNCDIKFESNSTGHTIECDGTILTSNIIFNGLGSSYKLLDSLKTTKNINIIYGKIDFNGQYIDAKEFRSSNSNLREINLDNCEMVLTNYSVNSSNCISSAQNCNILFQSVASNFLHINSNINFGNIFFDNSVYSSLTTTSATFNNVKFISDCNISGNNAFNILELGKGTKVNLAPNKTQTINTSLTAVGSCDSLISLESSGVGANIFKSNGTVTIEYCELEYINAQGGATFIANESFDLGNNTGWTINTPGARTLYWVNGSGGWSDKRHWSLSSGGPNGECMPTKYDNVVFDNNSFPNTDTVTVNIDSAVCNNFNWIANNFTNYLIDTTILPQTLNIFGSLYADETLINEFDAPIYFLSDSIETIEVNKTAFINNIYFDMSGGQWSLIDDSVFVNGSVNLFKGNLISQNNVITALAFSSPDLNNRKFDITNSHLHLEGSFYINDTSLTFLSSNSKIFLNGSTPELRSNGNFHYNYIEATDNNSATYFYTDSAYINRLIINGSSFIKGLNVIGDLILREKSYHNLRANSNQTILDTLYAQGSCEGMIFIECDDIYGNAYISKYAGAINIDRVILKNIHATGFATFNATNSIDLGNNLNWSFTNLSPRNLYWVGGSGSWSDSSHWAASSGGQGGECIPTPIDNVFFDSQSFSNSDCNVEIDIFNPVCHDMDWSGINLHQNFVNADNNRLNIYGSLILSDSLNYNLNNSLFFRAEDSGNIINSNMAKINSNVHFKGKNGEWTLQDSLLLTDSMFLNFFDIDHETGTFIFNGYSVRCKEYNANYSYNKTLDLENSFLFLKKAKFQMDSTFVFADSSKINVWGITPFIFAGGIKKLNLWQVYFNQPAIGALVVDSATYKLVKFNSGGVIEGRNYFDTLFFTENNVYKIEPNFIQHINILKIQSLCTKPVSIESSIPGTQAQFRKNNGIVDAHFLKLKDINAFGGAVFNAYDSEDIGNTTGWNIIQSQPKDLYWINGTGVWSDPYHWSATSGGTPQGCIPGPTDNVFFDNNSFINHDDTAKVDILASCNNMTWLVNNALPVFKSKGKKLNIHGSLIFCDSMNNQFSKEILFKSDTTGNIINPASQSFSANIQFMNNGTWTFMDDISISGGGIYIKKGHINGNAKNIKLNQITATTNDNRTLNISNCKINIKSSGSSFHLNNNNLNFIANNSEITFEQDAELKLIGSGAYLNFHNVNFQSETGVSKIINNIDSISFGKVIFKGNGEIYGKNSMDSLILDPGNLYRFDHSKTQFIRDYLYARGNNCTPTLLESTQFNNQADIYKNSGSVTCDFLNIRDINAFGNANFYAGDNSTDISNNSGWIFGNNPGYIFGLGNDTNICSNDPYELSTINFNGGDSFLWNTGSTNPSININQSGTYWVSVTYDNNCTITDTIDIEFNPIPSINLGNDTTICENDTLILQAPSNYIQYYWSTGENTQSINVNKDDTYFVLIKDSNNCVNSDTINVSLKYLPTVDLGRDTYLCYNDSTILYSKDENYDNLWQDSSTNYYFVVKKPGDYYLQSTNSCGSRSDTINFYLLDCSFVAPNVFTPNGDSYNDNFVIIIDGVVEYHLQIFNRWGRQLFKSNNIDNTWDGKHNGQKCSDGVYFYTVKYSVKKQSGEILKFLRSGSVTLIR